MKQNALTSLASWRRNFRLQYINFYSILQIMLLCCCFHTVCGQDKGVVKSKLQDNGLLRDNDLFSWLKTDYDFDYAAKTSEEIDKKIDEIIKSQSGKPVIDIQTPINFKKLKYYGYTELRNLEVIGKREVSYGHPYEYMDAAQAKNIFQYDNMYFVCTYNSFEDQVHVYSIIRAYLILKNKYPEIYNWLFKRTEQLQLGSDINKNIRPDKTVFLNVNKKYVFVIHQNPSTNHLPATTTYYGDQAKLPAKLINDGNYLLHDNNAHFVFFHKATIRNGGTPSGNTPIYSDVAPVDRHYKYLFDGIIQSIVHERIHNYISNYQPVDDFLYFIRNDLHFLNGNVSYSHQEEPIVTNTTNQLFATYGGLSSEVQNHYEKLFRDTQLPQMKRETDYQKLLEQLSSLNTSCPDKSNENLVLKIYF